MNYLEIDTTEQLLNAFKACQNAGEEIQLFESLAERENPPVEAFVEILRKIKLETVLALAIQAFGKITNDDVKATLKGSEELLAMLCEQAKSGSTDLIRWSAATTIENIGFSFIDVSQYLTEEPKAIANHIRQLKLDVLDNASKHGQSITEAKDYDSFIKFWIYGNTYWIRVWTAHENLEDPGGNNSSVVHHVVKAQGVWGIKQTNCLFSALESRIPLADEVKRVYENQLFELECQMLCDHLLLQNLNSADLEILVSSQLHCLQSNFALIRHNAARLLTNPACSNILYKLQQ
jgi:hypothetical protein